MKAFNHDNVNEFVGMCINLLDVYVVTGQCHKGSLQVCYTHTLFRDLLSRSSVYHLVWSVKTADNFTPAKRDESFSAMFAEP